MTQAKSSIAQTLIKIRLSQGFPTFEVKDDITNREVSAAKGSKADATKVMVKLVGDNEAYKKAKFDKGQLYLHYLNVTSPWEDRGARMMLGMHSLETMDELRNLKAIADESAERFCLDEYPAIYERAVFQATQGGNGLGALAMNVVNKYPTPDTVRAKFYNNLFIEPMGEVETLRKLGNVFTEQDVSEYANLIEQRLQAAEADAWSKLAEPLTALIEKCASATEKNPWSESITQNVRDMVCLIDRINVNNNPEMRKLAADMLDVIKGVDKETLKHDPVVRDDTRAKAEALMARMAGYL